MSTTPPSVRRASLLAVGALTAATLVSWPAQAAPSAAGTPLPVTEVTWTGETGGTFGTALSRTACDVNGDGRDDVIVGDWGWDRPGYANTGAGYVLLGGDELTGGDVADFDAAHTRRIDGPSVTVTGGAWVGWSASCLGDVNGDGIEDFALGSGSRNYQSVHVILGDRDLQSIDLDHLGARGFLITDPGAAAKTDAQGQPVLDGATDNFGFAVGAVGDLDDDGLDDIGVVDLLADRSDRSNSGRVWVVAGSRSVRNVDVSTDAARVLFTVDGAAGNDRLGSVSAGGDVNGDGVDDFVMSSYTATPWGASAPVAGAAYVVFGGAEAAQQVDLADLGEDGFEIRGPARGRDRLGVSVAPAGDVDGDGLADVVVGADGVSTAGAPRSGGAAVVLGAESTATVLVDPAAAGATVFTCDDTTSDPSCAGSSVSRRGYWIDGASDGDKAGFTVGSIADVTGDDAPEVLLGAQSGSQGTWLVHGSATADRVSLASLPADAGQLLGTGRPSALGTAGDLDGNGTDDVVAGGGNAVSAYLLGAAKSTVEPVVPTVALSHGEVGYGAAVTATVDVDHTLTGDVEVLVDGRSVARATPQHGSATLALPRRLAVGRHQVSARYLGDAEREPSAPSAAIVLRVRKAALAGAPRVTVRRGRPAVVRVVLGRLDNGEQATGPVRIKVGSVKRVVRVTAADRGRVRVTWPRRAPKGAVVRVRYLGSPTTAPSRIVTARLR